jgi:hypothetical protein
MNGFLLNVVICLPGLLAISAPKAGMVDVDVQTEKPRPQYVTKDPITGDLLVRFPENLGQPDWQTRPGPIRTIVAKLTNHVQPSVVVTVVKQQSGSFVYSYVIQNGGEARQPITDWHLMTPVKLVREETTQPQAWTALTGQTSSNPQAGNYHDPPGFSVWWSLNIGGGSEGIQPGQQLDHFTVQSEARPGIVDSYFSGGGPPLTCQPVIDAMPPSTPPSVFSKVCDEMQPYFTIIGSSQTAIVLGPVFAVDLPKTSVASRLADTVRKLIEKKELDSHSPFVQESLQVLVQYAHSPDRALQFTAKPHGNLEEQLYQAIMIDLGPGF